LPGEEILRAQNEGSCNRIPEGGVETSKGDIGRINEKERPGNELRKEYSQQKKRNTWVNTY